MLRFAALGVAALLAAPAAAGAGPSAQAPMTGHWSVAADLFGTRFYQGLDIEQRGTTLSGTLDGGRLQGRVEGDAVRFTADDIGGGKATGEGRLKDGVLSGTMLETDAAGRESSRYPFTATPRQARPAGPPRRHEFVPSVFYRTFSADHPPALTISPGDTVHTTTVDAAGVDGKGVKRAVGGNPQTGPFYVRSALPGDTLVVRIIRLKLNRDYAVSDDALVPRALGSDLAAKMSGFKEVRWRLDLANGLASPETPSERLAKYVVPVRPMLGCIAASPSPARGGFPTGDSGSWGGNMDFNEIGEGATVYLPVSVPGALLFLGDAHAAQGDGELTGNALETSMDVEFSVDVIPGQRVPAPRVETASQIMAMGLNGSIDDAFKDATSNMAAWLARDYGLSPSETAQVLGTAAEYKVSEAADRNAGVVLKIRKTLLEGLRPAAKN